MTEQEENQDRIEQYLQGKMSATEREAFEAACAADPKLADGLADEKAVRHLARAIRMLELKDGLQAHIEGKRRSPKPKVQRFIWVVVAAAAALIVAFLLWMRPPSYKSYALELMADASVRGSGSAEAPLQKAMQYLANDDAKAAMPILRLIAQDSTPAAEDVLYYIAIAHALDQRRDSSQMYLMRYMSIPGRKYRQEAGDLLRKF
jgi:hypothetical protein